MHNLDERIREDDKKVEITLSEIYNQIISNLIGFLGNTKSDVLHYIIEDWIVKNSKKLKKEWKINIKEIRNLYYSNKIGDLINKDLALRIIDLLPKCFEVIKSVRITNLARVLQINDNYLRRIIILFGDKIIEKGLNIRLDDDLIINLKFKW